MSFLKKIFGGVNTTSAKKLYGTVEEWRSADKKQLSLYKENISQAVKEGRISPLMLGRFLITINEVLEGESILYKATQDKVAGAESDYVDSMSYYFMVKDRYNQSAKQDKWFTRWIEMANRCVENGEEDAEVRLADIYKACYSIKDPEFNDLVPKITHLYEVAASKHQTKAALNYAVFIMDKIGSEEYGRLNPVQSVPWKVAEKYILQALLDEKNTQDRDYAYSTMAHYYTEFIRIDLENAIGFYFDGKEISEIAKNIEKNKKEIIKHQSKEITPKSFIQSSLNNYSIHFDFLCLSSALKAENRMISIADDYVYQINRKRFADIQVSMKKEEAMDALSEYYLTNERELNNKGIKFTTATYEFMKKRKEGMTNA
ncbi:hypothetical protein [Listeria grandensis]|uniref:hypothetical protein n=1 Tax=Listeria grandensis TaxID=1494963 RepID=UPI00164E7E11|nr:hypothetical protein [Listeria grandensis]MBC6314284.1 hypothetical protein [Listeria grandensis]